VNALLKISIAAWLVLWLVPSAFGENRSAGGVGELRFADDLVGPISASVYSLPSALIDADEAGALLAAVRAHAPGRELLVLGDEEQRRRLGPSVRELELVWLESGELAFSPWPRDPLSFGRGESGAVRLLARPNLQTGREADFSMARQITGELPEEIDRAWGGVGWLRSPVPFHNGHLLSVGETLWLSLHSLEPRILEILGEPRVPVASFATPGGVERYLGAARRAAAELGELFGREVRFVHPLPETGTARERSAVMAVLGGGAGFDLDALVTFLPGDEKDGPPRALVADLGAGGRLASGLSVPELESFRRGFELAPAAADLGALLAEAQKSPRALALGRFLDLVARHLESSGLEVERLPFLLVPAKLLADREGVDFVDFPVGWNNAVIEAGAGRVRAEAFSMHLPAGDELARSAFERFGAELVLLPPLRRSIVLGGGYRCASNHLRSSAR